MNIHGIFTVKDASQVEKQKPVDSPESTESMEIDSVPSDIQLPEVDKMADKTAQNAAGEEPPEENDDPAQDTEDMSEAPTENSNASDKEGLPGSAAEAEKEKVWCCV